MKKVSSSVNALNGLTSFLPYEVVQCLLKKYGCVNALNGLSSFLQSMKKPYYITYSAETVVYNSNGEKIVACPTEQEAIEYINDCTET